MQGCLFCWMSLFFAFIILSNVYLLHNTLVVSLSHEYSIQKMMKRLKYKNCQTDAKEWFDGKDFIHLLQQLTSALATFDRSVEKCTFKAGWSVLYSSTFQLANCWVSRQKISLASAWPNWLSNARLQDVFSWWGGGLHPLSSPMLRRPTRPKKLT